MECFRPAVDGWAVAKKAVSVRSRAMIDTGNAMPRVVSPPPAEFTRELVLLDSGALYRRRRAAGVSSAAEPGDLAVA